MGQIVSILLILLRESVFWKRHRSQHLTFFRVPQNDHSNSISVWMWPVCFFLAKINHLATDFGRLGLWHWAFKDACTFQTGMQSFLMGYKWKNFHAVISQNPFEAVHLPFRLKPLPETRLTCFGSCHCNAKASQSSFCHLVAEDTGGMGRSRTTPTCLVCCLMLLALSNLLRIFLYKQLQLEVVSRKRQKMRWSSSIFWNYKTSSNFRAVISQNPFEAVHLPFRLKPLPETRLTCFGSCHCHANASESSLSACCKTY